MKKRLVPRTGLKGAKMQVETNLGGRPPLPEAARKVVIQVRMPPALIADIDAVVVSRADAPDRSQIIRELLAEALEARRRRGKS